MRGRKQRFGINRWRDKKKTRFNVSCLVLEGLGSQSFVERCKVSGQTLKVVFYLLLLKDKNWGVSHKQLVHILPADVVVMATINHCEAKPCSSTPR